MTFDLCYYFKGQPKVTSAQHEGRFEIRCTAEGNYSPPQIWWKLDHGPEILGKLVTLKM